MALANFNKHVQTATADLANLEREFDAMYNEGLAPEITRVAAARETLRHCQRVRAAIGGNALAEARVAAAEAALRLEELLLNEHVHEWMSSFGGQEVAALPPFWQTQFLSDAALVQRVIDAEPPRTLYCLASETEELFDGRSCHWPTEKARAYAALRALVEEDDSEGDALQLAFRCTTRQRIVDDDGDDDAIEWQRDGPPRIQTARDGRVVCTVTHDIMLTLQYCACLRRIDRKHVVVHGDRIRGHGLGTVTHAVVGYRKRHGTLS